MNFYDKVYEIVKQIPPGRVMTYQQVANLAGSPKAARAVGTAMARNPDNTVIPCHRVVGSDGRLRGFAFGDGIVTKRLKLEVEGVVLRGDRVDLTRLEKLVS